MRPHHRCWSPHPHSKSTVKPGCRSGRQEHVPKEQRTNTTPCSAGRSMATLQDLAVVAPTGRAEFPMDRKRWRPGTVQTPGACHFICLQGLTYSNINRQRLLLVPLLSDRRGIPFCIQLYTCPFSLKVRWESFQILYCQFSSGGAGQGTPKTTGHSHETFLNNGNSVHRSLPI